MLLFLKKISHFISGSLFPALITIYLFLTKKIKMHFIYNRNFKIKKNYQNKKINFLDISKLQIDLDKPFFILGCGASINKLSDDEKRFIESSTSVGINLFVVSDLNLKFYTWQRPKNQDIQNTFLEALKNKNQKFYDQNPKLILYDAYLHAGFDPQVLLKYFESVDVYSCAKIFSPSQKKLENIYKYLFHPWILKLLGRQMVYGLHTTVDHLTHFAISAGFKEIVYVGVDLNNAEYFWDEMKYKNSIQILLDKLPRKDKNKQHSTERKVGFIPVTEIIKILYKYGSSKNIKFYTTSKKSKLYSFMPQYVFPKIEKKNKTLNNF